MKIESLRTLEAILRLGSFARAGEEVGLTASAVSLQMKRLEDYLGKPLFDRSTRTVRPLPFAEELVEATRGAVHVMETARSQAVPAVSGRVVMGSIRTVQSTALPAALREIDQRYPELAVRVVQGDSVELLRQLQAGELDAAVLIRPSSGGSGRLLWHDLERQQYVFVAPPGTEGLSVEQLLERYAWIQFDTSLTGGAMAAKYAQRIAPKTRARFELESIDAIHKMVSQGWGVSLLPQLRQPLGAAYPVREIALAGQKQPARQIAFVCRRADADNRRITALREAFVRSFASKGR